MKTYILNIMLLLLLGVTVILQIQSVESSYSDTSYSFPDTPLYQVVENSTEYSQFAYLLKEHEEILPSEVYTIFIPHNEHLPDFQTMSSQEEQQFLKAHIISHHLTYEETLEKNTLLTSQGTWISQVDLEKQKGKFNIFTQDAVMHGINTPLY